MAPSRPTTSSRRSLRSKNTGGKTFNHKCPLAFFTKSFFFGANWTNKMVALAHNVHGQSGHNFSCNSVSSLQLSLLQLVTEDFKYMGKMYGAAIKNTFNTSKYGFYERRLFWRFSMQNVFELFYTCIASLVIPCVFICCFGAFSEKL